MSRAHLILGTPPSVNVYRNFPTKRDPLMALGEHLGRHAGYELEPPPHNPQDLERTIRDAYRQADSLSAEIQAVYASAVGLETRRERDVPEKLRVFGEALAPVLGLLPRTSSGISCTSLRS